MAEQHWCVAQVFSKRAGRIRLEAEGMDCGGFLPHFAKVRFVNGEPARTKHQLMPGYLFVKLRDQDRAAISELEGVYRILPGGEHAMRRLDAELASLQLKEAMGQWNELEPPPAERRRRHRRRRPRPGKRARMRAKMGAAA